MYADDVEIFNTFNNLSRFDLLRADFWSSYKWCNVNLLELNIKKSKHITFFRHSMLDIFFCIENDILDKIKAIFNFGILLDHRHNFSYNISMIVSL